MTTTSRTPALADWQVDRPPPERPAEHRRDVLMGWAVLLLFVGGWALLIGGAMTDTPVLMFAPLACLPAAILLGKRGLAREEERWSAADARTAEIVAVKAPPLKLELLLALDHADGTPYRAVAMCEHDREREAYASPGRKLLVKVNPVRPWRVRVDWPATLAVYGSAMAGAEGAPDDIKTVSLTCVSCGARLDGLASKAVVRCQYCHTENHVVRS